MLFHAADLVIGICVMTFNNTIICFGIGLLAHSLHKVNMKET